MGGNKLALVYNWAQNGHVIDYLKSHPDESRPTLVSTFSPNAISYLTSISFLGDSCWRLRKVSNTFTRSMYLMEI